MSFQNKLFILLLCFGSYLHGMEAGDLPMKIHAAHLNYRENEIKKQSIDLTGDDAQKIYHQNGNDHNDDSIKGTMADLWKAIVQGSALEREIQCDILRKNIVTLENDMLLKQHLQLYTIEPEFGKLMLLVAKVLILAERNDLMESVVLHDDYKSFFMIELKKNKEWLEDLTLYVYTFSKTFFATIHCLLVPLNKKTNAPLFKSITRVKLNAEFMELIEQSNADIRDILKIIRYVNIAAEKEPYLKNIMPEQSICWNRLINAYILMDIIDVSLSDIFGDSLVTDYVKDMVTIMRDMKMIKNVTIE